VHTQISGAEKKRTPNDNLQDSASHEAARTEQSAEEQKDRKRRRRLNTLQRNNNAEANAGHKNTKHSPEAANGRRKS
jgi:hypothetical protein